MEDFNKLRQEFEDLKSSTDHSHRTRMREIYNIFSREASDIFLMVNEYDNDLCQSFEVTHQNLIRYGLYEGKVASIDQYGARLNIKGAKFQAKVDHHHIQTYQSYNRGNKVEIGDKLKIIIVTHKPKDNGRGKRETNAVIQKYPGHEQVFKFYEIHNKNLSLENIQLGGIYKGFINGVVPEENDPPRGTLYICLNSIISGRVRINNIKNYEIGRIVDVKVLKKSGESLSKNTMREDTRYGVNGKFEFYI